MTKKSHQKFLEIDENLMGEILTFVRETPKKGCSQISAKI